MQQIGVEWINGIAEGAIELYEVENLYIPAQGKIISCSFKRKNRTQWETYVNLLYVEGNIVIIDCEPFQEQNEKLNLYPGQIKLKMSGDVKSPHIEKAYWKDIDSDDFIEFDFNLMNFNKKDIWLKNINSDFSASVNYASSLSNDERKKFLPPDGNLPKIVVTKSSSFVRNPFIVAEVLWRAKGICEKCNLSAPFISASTGEPYLEVHHIVHLAKYGTDDIKNTIAVCPNCHKELHFGSP